jgi:hypothetical protein
MDYSAGRVDDRYTTWSYLSENSDWGEGRASWKAAQVASIIEGAAEFLPGFPLLILARKL